MNRIRSQHGNVIAADFRPQSEHLDLTLSLRVETLYSDGHVMLVRTTASIGDKPVFIVHGLGELATGRFTSL